jgi:capsular exopolysaccharide synthesis family protein
LKISKRLVLLVFLLVLACFALYNYHKHISQDNEKPVINCDETEIQVSVSVTNEELLEGLTATDNVDGDITNKIMVEGFSDFIEGTTRNVNYAVCDSSNNVTKFSRLITYTDYEAPKFELSDSLVYNRGDEIEVLDRIMTSDVLDGDLTLQEKLLFSDIYYAEIGDYEALVGVSNSAGDYVEYSFDVKVVPYEYNNKTFGTEINLKSYLIYIEKGSKFKPLSYVDSVYLRENNKKVDKDELKVESDVDTDTPGMYNVVYTYTNDEGYTDVEQLVVIAEEMHRIKLLEIDFQGIIRDILFNLEKIIMVALTATMIAYMVFDYTYVPKYTTKASFAVTSTASNGYSYVNVNATVELAEVFSELLSSSALEHIIAKDLGTGSTIPGTIKAEALTDTNILEVSVTSYNSEDAYRVIESAIDNYYQVSQYVYEDVVLDDLEKPQIPETPSNPGRIGRKSFLVFLLAFVAMTSLVVFDSVNKDTIKTERDFNHKIDAGLFGTVKKEKRKTQLKNKIKRVKKSFLITDLTISLGFVESIKKIRIKFETLAKQKGYKILLCTSVSENEGKSTIAANIAIALAQKGNRVVLVDGDLRQPAQYKILEQSLTPDMELGKWIEGKASIKDVLHYNKNYNMYTVFGSISYDNATDLLSGEKFEKLLELLKDKVDYIVIDTPPMMAGSDVEIVSEYADASLLVVRQNESMVQDINDTIDMINQCKSKLLGCVFNNVRKVGIGGDTTSYGYGYGYGGYGKYGHYGKYGKYGRYDGHYGYNRKESAKLQEDDK